MERDKRYSEIAEQQGLFSTFAGSVELPPEVEHPGFGLGIFYMAQASES